MRNKSICAKLILVALHAGFLIYNAHASMMDPLYVSNKYKITDIEIANADIFECCSILKQALMETTIENSEKTYDNDIMSVFSIFVGCEIKNVKKRNVGIYSCTIQEAGRIIGEKFGVKFHLDGTMIIFSDRDIPVPLIKDGEVPRDGEVEAKWIQQDDVNMSNFDFSDKHQRDILQSMLKASLVGDNTVNIQLHKPSEKDEPKTRMGVWGRWRYLEFFRIIEKYDRRKITIHQNITIEVR